ncbi:hypothetical protein NHF45_06105 [Maricaulaceae bacterium NA33B04]|nr:hypothetical protein [Maricaulaceae bacterium NA33B04]
MATDTSGGSNPESVSGETLDSQQVWTRVQPIVQTLDQWIVAAILLLCIFVGCYTLLLTWPLTQSNAHVDYEGRCDEASEHLNWFDRQVYAMVLEPCRDGDSQESPADREARLSAEAAEAEATAPAAFEVADVGASTGAEDEGGTDNEAATLEEPPQAPDPTAIMELVPPGTEKPDKDSDDGEAESSDGGVKSSAYSRQPNALFIAVLAAGLTGGAVYSLRSHTIHVAHRTHDPSWGLWTLTRPFLGAALAVFLFFLIRAGFVQNSGGSGAGALRPEGFIALGGLVGLFSDQAWARMRIVAESIFSPRDSKTQPEDTRQSSSPATAVSRQSDPEPAQGGDQDNRPQG